MMPQRQLFTWTNAWFRWGVVTLAAFSGFSILVGFILLPSVHQDYGLQGLWASICRAAGDSARWADTSFDRLTDPHASGVVLDQSMTHQDANDAVGRGATLALNCTMCHGAQGISTSNSPNLAGQYHEVIIKQLYDFKSGKRSSSIMEAIAAGLTDANIRDLAAYFAYLPRARTAPTTYDETLPALVRVGAPMRNIAPCISCHGDVDQKLGAPWLEGMPKDYLISQLRNFATGARRNDSEAQMRNMARTLTADEMDEVAGFYARKASPGEAR